MMGRMCGLNQRDQRALINQEHMLDMWRTAANNVNKVVDGAFDCLP